MPIKIIPYKSQALTKHRNGALEENKPIGFTADMKAVRPYSNLFYWANTWTDMGSEVSKHPHQGFEIFTYVLSGVWEHFDESKNKWMSLAPGDVHIIRAGSGISHSEKFHPDTQVFQIWFDPNLKKSLAIPSSYQIIPADKFYTEEIPNLTSKIICDAEWDTPLKLSTEKITIRDNKITPGHKSYKLDPSLYYSWYLLKGELEINNKIIRKNDFFIVKGEDKFDFHVSRHARLFVISSPIRPNYNTYLELKSRN